MYCFKTKESAAKKIMTAAEGWAVMSECKMVVPDTENVLKKWNEEKEFVIAFWQNGVDGGERGYIGRLVQKVNQTCFLCFIVPSQKYGITVRFQIVQK